MYPIRWNEDDITANLLDAGERLPASVREGSVTYRQISLFDDYHITSY